MKQFFLKTTFAILSVILFYGCSQEPYDWSEGKTVINNAETSFPLIQNEAIQIKSYFNTKGGSFKVEHSLCINKGNKWEVIETKEATPVNGENGYFASEFSNLQGNTEYQIIISVYNLKDVEKPIYQEKLNVKTAIDEYSIASGDEKEVTQTTATIITEFSSEKLKPKENELGIVYSTNENDIKSNKSIFVPYSSNTDIVYFTDLSELQPATTYYYCACIIINGQRTYAEEIRSFQTKEIEITEEKIVDLGLSVKWMSYNLGANTIEDDGKYYGWGDPIGISSMDREDYPTLKNISGTGYDAAWYNLGMEYRIPTEEEWNELVEKCEWEWITYKGKNGYKITSSNGNSIFLPASGYRWMSDGGVGSYNISGQYRIGDLEEVGNYIYSFEIKEDDYSKSHTMPREWGMSIRPVYDNSVYSETSTANEITGTSVKLTGLFKSNSDKTVSECGIWYGTTEFPHPEMGTECIASNNSGNIEITINGLKLNTTYYYCVYVVINDMTYYSSTNKFTTLSEANISTDELVDLGLSVKWRGYNLGANTPEEHGYESYGNELFGDDPLIEYICGTKYDKASKELGGEWRLATKNEYEELINKCIWIRTFYKDVEGYQAIGPNGNSIFFPEFDYSIGDWFYRYFEDTFYMCGEIYSIDTKDNEGAISGLRFAKDGVRLGGSYSSNRKETLIRPVHP